MRSLSQFLLLGARGNPCEASLGRLPYEVGRCLGDVVLVSDELATLLNHSPSRIGKRDCDKRHCNKISWRVPRPKRLNFVGERTWFSGLGFGSSSSSGVPARAFATKIVVTFPKRRH